MKAVRIVSYHAHKDYNVKIDTNLLNMKIRIFGKDFHLTGIIFYEGTVGKFIKERKPSEFVVKLLEELKYKDAISYTLSGGENFIERII